MLKLPENLLLASKVWMLIFNKMLDFSVILNHRLKNIRFFKLGNI